MLFRSKDKFVKELSKIGINFSFYVSYNTKRTNLIMYNANVLYGDNDIKTEILGVKTFVNPMSFMQINDYVRDLIYLKTKELVVANKSKIVVDSYSGVGILTNIIAEIADKVYGIEIVPEATANANQLAKINGKEGKIINICGDSAVELPKLAEKLNNTDFITILDPPRKGCDTKVLEGLLKAQPSKIIYISCNPATLARDISILKNTYNISLIQPYDLFPQTSHIETLVCLDRK